MIPLLSCQAVTKSFGATPLFSEISLTINEKERLGLIGPNGSGKSTFLKVMSGILPADSGEISIKKETRLVYLPQEGRGIGLLDKLRAYNLQDVGYDTVDANLLLGHQADERDYTVAALILKDLGVYSVRLLTNNPKKIESLQELDVSVTARVSLQPRVTSENAAYLTTKAERMNHLFDLAPSFDVLVRHCGNGRD